ncbi:MAG: oligosaccharide repeat unit polymerase [Ruminococcus flavefaciens]|nr:oligosaccharide repeat unit polymerase [Ruminococcus flavefaciens]
MLLIILAVTILFIIINYKVACNDYMHPSVLFCVSFLASEILCVFNIVKYDIHFHSSTLLVFSIGFLAMTVANMIGRSLCGKGKRNYGHGVEIIQISNNVVLIIIIIQLIAIISLISFLKSISIAYQGHITDISSMIHLYNNMTNFWTGTYSSLNVTIPMAYRICNPIGDAGAYLIVYTVVNNFVVNRMINKLHIISIGLLCFEIILNSSRTPLLNLIIMVCVLLYILQYRDGKGYLGSLKSFSKLIMIALVSVVLFITISGFIGRAVDIDIFQYIFIYTGAPILNFDNFLYDGNFHRTVWGLNTFGNLYRYVFKLLGLDTSGIQPVSNILRFTTSNNGLDTGNVYSIYYSIVNDFGIAGVFPLILIIGLYFSISYERIFHCNYRKEKIDFNLLIYSYLFISVVMPFFSEKFFATIFNAPFIKFVIISPILSKFIFLYNKKIVFKLHD